MIQEKTNIIVEERRPNAMWFWNALKGKPNNDNEQEGLAPPGAQVSNPADNERSGGKKADKTDAGAIGDGSPNDKNGVTDSDQHISSDSDQPSVTRGIKDDNGSDDNGHQSGSEVGKKTDASVSVGSFHSCTQWGAESDALNVDGATQERTEGSGLPGPTVPHEETQSPAVPSEDAENASSKPAEGTSEATTETASGEANDPPAPAVPQEEAQLQPKTPQEAVDESSEETSESSSGEESSASGGGETSVSEYLPPSSEVEESDTEDCSSKTGRSSGKIPPSLEWTQKLSQPSAKKETLKNSKKKASARASRSIEKDNGASPRKRICGVQAHSVETVNVGQVYSEGNGDGVPESWRLADQDGGFPWRDYLREMIAWLGMNRVVYVYPDTSLARQRMVALPESRRVKYEGTPNYCAGDLCSDLSGFFSVAWAIRVNARSDTQVNAGIAALKTWKRYVHHVPVLDKELSEKERTQTRLEGPMEHVFGDISSTFRKYQRARGTDITFDVAVTNTPKVRFSCQWMYEAYCLAYTLVGVGWPPGFTDRRKHYCGLSMVLYLHLLACNLKLGDDGVPEGDYISGLAREALHLPGSGAFDGVYSFDI